MIGRAGQSAWLSRFLSAVRLKDDQSTEGGSDEVSAADPVSPGLLLQPAEMATTVRIQDGKTQTTDGPFVAVNEALGGYLVFEADDLDAAIELAARIPQVSRGACSATIFFKRLFSCSKAFNRCASSSFNAP
jgi:hypothetical protein